MSSVNVIRVKRKADEEPAEALVIALKKSKRDAECGEVYLKFATTLTNAADFNNGFIQDAIRKDKLRKAECRKSPKHVHAGSSFSKRVQILKEERNEKRQQVLADRRLILAHNPLKVENEETKKSNNMLDDLTEVRNMFKLYDIIEENEEPKVSEPDEQKTGDFSTITCNGVPLVRMTDINDTIDYVYDVYYVAGGTFNDRFMDESVSVQPCAFNEELVYESDESEEFYDDEDDSNDESNWRNDYPDEDSDFEKERDYFAYADNDDPVDFDMLQKFKKFAIDEEKLGSAYAAYKARICEEFEKDEEDDDDD